MNPTPTGPKPKKPRRRSLSTVVRLAQWSLRKLQLPIRSTDLVLDVGSGSNPHPRADVLLERHISGQHRHGAVAVVDRPIVLADACRMPFKDKAFDYVIAFHVLEHIPTPDLFLRELMRIARAGYIETPNVLFEHLIPYDVHCLEVMDLGGRLIIQKKVAPASDPFLAQINIVGRSARWRAFFYGNPEYFHVQYHWSDRIDFEILNPEEPCSWYMRGADSADVSDVATSTATGGLRGAATKALRNLYAFRRPAPNLASLLACPTCRSALLLEDDAFRCPRCRVQYPGRPWPVFIQPADPRIANDMDLIT